MKTNFYPTLPPKLKNKWHITKVISTTEFKQIYIINSNHNSDIHVQTENIRILKIISETNFDKNIYKKISSIKSKYIQTPEQIILYKHYYYIIYKYQKSLRQLICQNGIYANDILHIADNIITALNIIHSKNIIHLDCTPSNIYLNDDGSYCLGDFSSALSLKNKKDSVISSTIGYTPPELIKNIPPDFLSDEYVLSCLLYTLFNNGYTIEYNYIKDNIPSDLYDIILKGISNNPSDRFSSLDELNSAVTSPEITESLANYNYFLCIQDTSHPIHYLKTSAIKDSFSNNAAFSSKRKSHKKNLKSILLNCSLIFITGFIFLFSFYGYINKKPVNNSEKLNISTQTNNENNNITFTKEADISNRNLLSIPNSQCTEFLCNKLTCLYAYNNKINNLDNIKDYTSLNELYISDNLITDLSPLEDCSNLKILVLSYNKLTDLIPISSLTKLTNLDLSGNTNICNYTELVSLFNLKTLNVTNTNIKKEEIEFLSSNLPNCKIFY